MSTQPTRCQSAPGHPARPCEPARIVDLLSDPKTRRMFHAFERPQTAKEIGESLGIPSSTVYRKINTLEEVGLIVPTDRGGGATRYVRSLDCVAVVYDDPIRLECTANGVTHTCEPELEAPTV